MVAKTIFGYCVIMLIYANQRENDGVDLFIYLFIYVCIFFFLRQKKRIRQLDNKKK